MELYNKYRPSTWDDVVGNDLAIKTIRKELENGSHSFLFVGSAGNGKTTFSRILAKDVGADELSTIEINSADNRGIDTAREILENMKYKSLNNSTVYILDEVHATNSIFQNSMLKALEEAPDDVYFCLCTTDPQKLIEPLKSRCSIVNIKPLNFDDMCYLIKRTARSEKIKICDEVIEDIATKSDNSCRKALKLLAKVLYLDNDEERKKVLSEYTDDENINTLELCRGLIKDNISRSELFKLVKNLDLTEPERVRKAVMGYMNTIILSGKKNDKAEAVMQAFSEAKTYSNGSFAITIAVLDYLSLLN